MWERGAGTHCKNVVQECGVGTWCGSMVQERGARTWCGSAVWECGVGTWCGSAVWECGTRAWCGSVVQGMRCGNEVREHGTGNVVQEHGAGLLGDWCLPLLRKQQEEAVLRTERVIFLHLRRAGFALRMHREGLTHLPPAAGRLQGRGVPRSHHHRVGDVSRAPHARLASKWCC